MGEGRQRVVGSPHPRSLTGPPDCNIRPCILHQDLNMHPKPSPFCPEPPTQLSLPARSSGKSLPWSSLGGGPPQRFPQCSRPAWPRPYLSRWGGRWRSTPKSPTRVPRPRSPRGARTCPCPGTATAPPRNSPTSLGRRERNNKVSLVAAASAGERAGRKGWWRRALRAHARMPRAPS